MASYNQNLNKLPELDKSDTFSRLFEGGSTRGSTLQEAIASTEASQSSVVDMNVKLWKGKPDKHSSMPYSPSCPLDDSSDDEDDRRDLQVQGSLNTQNFSAKEGSSNDDQESLFMMVPDPLSSYLNNLKFKKFLESWQKKDVSNDNVQGVNNYYCRRFGSSKSDSSNRSACYEDLPYSPSCEFVSSDENDVNPNLENRISARSKNKTKSGDAPENSNDNEAYTPSYSDSDFDMVGDSPDSVPDSAAAMSRISGRMKKLNRIERISSEVKIALDPFFRKKTIDKKEYKYIMKGAVTKIYQAKNKPIIHSSIKSFVESYVYKIQKRRKAERFTM